MAAITITESFRIVDGPSREEVFDALRLFSEKRRVEFTLEHAGTRYAVQAHVLAIAAEDGTSRSWNLTLIVPREQPGGVTVTNDSRILVYYHTGIREGAVNDATPAARQLTLDREGRIFLGANQIGEIPREVFS